MDRKSQILAFDFSSDSERQLFFKKLSELHGWSNSFCEKVFEEYKRFICLAATSGERAVPSKIVDDVWHLHLTFTKSYWHDLCRDLVGKDIHHIPSSTDSESRGKDLADYNRTLELYKSQFGEAPQSRYWPNPRSRSKRANKLWLPVLGFSTLLTACSSISSDGVKSLVMWAGGIYIVYRVVKWLSDHSTGGGGGGFGCSSCSSGCSGGCGGGS